MIPLLLLPLPLPLATTKPTDSADTATEWSRVGEDEDEESLVVLPSQRN